MDYTFQVSDEQYDKIAEYAAKWGKTPETLFQEWVQGTVNLMEDRRSFHRRQESGEEFLDDPLFLRTGIDSLRAGDPNWASRMNERLAEAYPDSHAENK